MRKEIPKTIIYINNQNNLTIVKNTIINYLYKYGFSKNIG